MSGGGGGGGNNTTVQKADPWSGVQPYLLDAYSRLSQLYQPGQGPQYYPGNTYAGMNPTQMQGANAALGTMGQLNGIANQGANALYQQGGLAGAGAAAGQNSAQASLEKLQTQGNLAYDNGMYRASGVADMLMNQGAAAQASGNAAMGDAMTNLGTTANQMYNTAYGNTNNAVAGLQAAGDFNNNPAYQAALQSAIRPVTETFNEQVLPGIKSGAQDAGQFGGSRQGIAEGLASRSYLDTVGSVAANMGNAAYAQGLGAMANAGQLSNQMLGQSGQNMANYGQLAANQAGQGLQAQQAAGNISTTLSGQGMQAQQAAGALGAGLYGTGLQGLGQNVLLGSAAQQGFLTAPNLQMGIGNQFQQNEQNQLDANVNQWNYNQNLPYTMMSDYLQMLQGQAGGQTTSTQSGGGSRLAGGLGGAASGAALGTAFAPGIGTGIGAGLGALYGLFM